MSMFGTILLSVFTLCHLYVFWRGASVPMVARWVPRKLLVAAGAILWAAFFSARVYGRHGTGTLASIVEVVGLNWMGVLFLMFVTLLAVDFITLFGFLVPRRAPTLRGWALVTGGLLSILALIQGFRPPEMQSYRVALRDLPGEMEGMVIVAMSDLHLGSQLGERWLARRVEQVQAERPDLVVLLGDIFEARGRAQTEMLATLGRLSAPLGVWAVPGNHDFHRDGVSLNLMKQAGVPVLRDRWVEVSPGLVLAGVDDFTTLRRAGDSRDSLSLALTGRPPGATILLSHTPWYAERASSKGVELMLSGHTHGGQIWPFGYLSRLVYPLLEGRYEVGGTTVIVCRGTGVWGPRMRLWRRGEILRITLSGEKEK